MVNLKVSDYVIGIVLFTMVVMGFFAFIAEFDAVDPRFNNDPTYERFNTSVYRYEEVISHGENINESISSANPDDEESWFGVFGFIDGLISSVWNTMKATVGSLGFMTSVFEGVAHVLPIPGWAVALTVTLITLIIGYAIFSLIFQRDT